MNESPLIKHIILEDVYISEGIKNRTIKSCPHCSALGTLDSGCNYIKCPLCNGDWCFLCSKGKGTGNNQCDDKTHNSH